MSNQESSSPRVVAAIALGANLGEPERTFKRALNLLERDADVQVLRRSHWHQTDPVGPSGQAPYTNGALLVETTLSARSLLDHMHDVEERLGRDRETEERFGPRVIDLDLLFVRGPSGHTVVREPGLHLPHPRLEERLFVLRPLAEVAADEVLLRSGRTVAQQLDFINGGGGLACLRSAAEAHAWCAASAEDGGTLGYVPLTAPLHRGHLEIVRRAARENDRVCASILAAPLRIEDPEEVVTEPSELGEAARELAAAGCSMVFTATLGELYPGGVLAARQTPGASALGLEGGAHPGRYDGVATLLHRLFEIAGATHAYVGAEDFQTGLVAASLEGAHQIVRCAVERTSAGLALLPCMERLDGAGREDALILHRSLVDVRAAWRQGLRDSDALAGMLRTALEHPRVEVEYAEIRDPAAWSEGAPAGLLGGAVALVAARIGGERVTDFLELSAP